MTRTTTTLAAFAAITLAAPAVHAQSLNINFGSYFYPNVSSTFAGAAHQAGTWNQITQTGTTSALSGLSGAATAVSLTETAETPNGGFGPHANADVNNLLDANFFSLSTTWSIVLSGVKAGSYDIYVYAPSNPAPVNTTPFTINGIAEAGITGDKTDSGILIPGVSYGQYRSIAVGADGKLTLAEISLPTGGIISGVAGLQLAPGTPAPAPEPSQWASFAIGLLGLGALAIKARRLAAH